MKKLLLILLCLPMLFSSCSKCKECIPSATNTDFVLGYEQIFLGEIVSFEYICDITCMGDTIWCWGQDSIFENGEAITINIPSQHSEVCKDNFQSKEDWETYIDHMENELGYTCKSDFWN